MTKAICSKIILSEQNRISKLYQEAVWDLLESQSVMRLDQHLQHLSTSRLQHCINVSYYSFRLARLFKADARAAARAGLLHDLYYYDFKSEDITCAQHSRLHPQLALQNARKLTSLTDAEEDIILTHMWPLTNKAPRDFEGYIVTFADKGCAILEVVTRLWNTLRHGSEAPSKNAA